MDISVNYLGVRFENPFVLASGPPTANAAMIARAFEAGWAGAVIKTLIREPVKNLHNRFAANKMGNNIYAFENLELLSDRTPEVWSQEIRELKKAYPDKVVIGSIMGDAKDKEHWLELALVCQEAGADMIELNFSCPHGYPKKEKGSAIGQNAEYSSKITGWLKKDERITIPIIPKLTAAVTDIIYIGEEIAKAGAEGICAINSFPSIMGFDLKTLAPKPNINGYSTAGGYSGPGLKPIALKCVNDLMISPGLPIMACGGISNGSDAIEFLLLGAPLVQVCTAVMLKGYSVISQMKKELIEFMEYHKFSRISDFLHTGHDHIRPFVRLDQNYIVKASIDIMKCTGCQQCFISCRDAGYLALEMQNNLAVVDQEKCVGCSLCSHVCSTGAIKMVEAQ
jgi:dihydropyrimidine dehydrogenase (NAD+) subunit PreA